MNASPIEEHEAARFERDGYLIRRGLIDTDRIEQLIKLIDYSLHPALAPVEFEADVHYPGAPESKSSPGGHTPRRLLQAYSRDNQFQDIARDPALVATLQELMGCEKVLLSQNHHNCVMTKHPGYSSVTSWHQDIRYWRFDRPELVSTWLALGSENERNGCLLVMPGSHRLELDPGRFDAALFLRTDIPENADLLASAIPVELEAGDVLFFHSRTLHAAGQNNSEGIKRTLVYTYRCAENEPIPETRSAIYQDIPVS